MEIDAQRFWNKVDKSGGDDACWLWQASRTTDGYGRVGINGTILYAHRVSWQIVHGAIPDGIFVCHHCDNPPCINPRHLFLGTNTDNVHDMLAKGRGNKASGARNGHATRPEKTLRGEANPQSKLTEESVRLIRQLYAAGGVSHRHLARRFGVGRSTIARILSGNLWKTVI